MKPLLPSWPYPVVCAFLGLSLGWRLRGPLVGAAATRGLVEAGIA